MSNDLYHDWIEASTKMKYWKKVELEKRDEILEEMAGQKDEGAVSKIVDTLKITAIYKMGRKINPEILDKIYNDLSDEEKESVKFVPEIVLKKYRELEDEGKSSLLEAITLRPAQGSIKIVEV